MSLEAWQTKAHTLIAAMCLASYKAANRGKRRHVPYSVPVDAQRLIDCLNRNDEQAAKALFLLRAQYGVDDAQSLTY